MVLGHKNLQICLIVLCFPLSAVIVLPTFCILSEPVGKLMLSDGFIIQNLSTFY